VSNTNTTVVVQGAPTRRTLMSNTRRRKNTPTSNCRKFSKRGTGSAGTKKAVRGEGGKARNLSGDAQKTTKHGHPSKQKQNPQKNRKNFYGEAGANVRPRRRGKQKDYPRKENQARGTYRQTHLKSIQKAGLGKRRQCISISKRRTYDTIHYRKCSKNNRLIAQLLKKMGVSVQR